MFAGLLSASLHVLASEILTFDRPVPRSSFEKIKTFSVNALQEDADNLSIARVDLNQDGLDEFVARKKECTRTTPCLYTILAESDDSIVSLGAFEGTGLLLGSEFTHGVRNLLVFENMRNDFDYVLYTWHPEVSAYRKARP